MAASRLLRAVAAFVILLSFAAGSRKSSWSGEVWGLECEGSSEKCEVWTVKCGVWSFSLECEERSVKCEVWSLKEAVRSEKCEVWVKCGVWSAKWEVWSVKFGVWSLEWEGCSEKWEVWSEKCEVWTVQCGVWRAQCEVWGLECEVWSRKWSSEKWEVWSVDCEVWSVKCEVWSLKCEVWSVKEAVRSEKWEVWSEKCEVWTVKCGVWSAKWEVWSVKFGVWRKQWEVRSVKCGVWSVKCEVRSEKCGLWSVKCEVWTVKCEVWSVDCEVWSVQCEVWSVRFGVWRKQWEVRCGVWSVECEVWSLECEECSVRCGVSREGHGRDRLSFNYRSFMFGKLPPPACPGLCYENSFLPFFMVLLNGPVQNFVLLNGPVPECLRLVHGKELPVPKGWNSQLPTWELQVTIARNSRFPEVGTHGSQPGNQRLPLQATADSHLGTTGYHCKELPVPKGWNWWFPTGEPKVTMARNCRFPDLETDGSQPGNQRLPLQGIAGSQNFFPVQRHVASARSFNSYPSLLQMRLIIEFTQGPMLWIAGSQKLEFMFSKLSGFHCKELRAPKAWNMVPNLKSMRYQWKDLLIPKS